MFTHMETTYAIVQQSDGLFSSGFCPNFINNTFIQLINTVGKVKKSKILLGYHVFNKIFICQLIN